VFERLVRDLLSDIAQTHHIPEHNLLQTCETFLNRSSHVSKCQGFIVSKNNAPCTCPAAKNEQYCKRHLYLKNVVNTPEKSVATRCSAVTKDGNQCVRDTKSGNTLCGLHLRSQQNKQMRKNERTPCAFYHEECDEFVFCKKHAYNDKWFCKSHAHLQPMYASIYKKKNLKDYLADSSCHNKIIESLLKENGIIR
jgi:hypothetical protein